MAKKKELKTNEPESELETFDDFFEQEDWINLNQKFKENPNQRFKLKFVDWTNVEESQYSGTIKYTFTDGSGQIFSLLSTGKKFFNIVHDKLDKDQYCLLYMKDNIYRIGIFKKMIR